MPRLRRRPSSHPASSSPFPKSCHPEAPSFGAGGPMQPALTTTRAPCDSPPPLTCCHSARILLRAKRSKTAQLVILKRSRESVHSLAPSLLSPVAALYIDDYQC